MDRLNPDASDTLKRAPDCDPHPDTLQQLIAPEAETPSSQERLARIVRTIEADIIPRLVRAHRPLDGAPAPAVSGLSLDDGAVRRFVDLVLTDHDGAAMQLVVNLRNDQVPVETLYLDLLAPAARELGRMWEEDVVLFSDVTVAVGRLQRIMRGLSPAFGADVDHPPDGRRVLLLPAPGEQHTFGLSMVAEFFRRAGWDVVCDLDSRAFDPVALVRAEWFDIIGISAGGDARVDWLESGIAAVRHASRNRAIGVMVGGPVFSADPARAGLVGADSTASDGRQAPVLAEQLLHERARRL